MQRRTFFKAVVGFLAAGVGTLLARDHVRDVTKKVKTPLDFWDDPAEDVYSKSDGQPIELNGDRPYGIQYWVGRSGVYKV